MSTNSTIATKINGKTKKIYCHWDGYLENNGNTLLEHYTTQEKVEELINLGNISSLRERVKPKENEVHTFDNPLDDVTIAYHRDRDRDKPLEFTNENQEFNYLFKDGVWYWKKYNQRKWNVLTKS
jgi:hypothetical protein